MSTNLPSYQNGSPHPIDNEPPPKGLHIKVQPTLTIIQATPTPKYTPNPKTLKEALENIRWSMPK